MLADVTRARVLSLRPRCFVASGEDYICDWVGFCVPPPGKLEGVARGASLRGRVRLCSASLLFDPDELRLPVLRFPLAKAEALEREPAGPGAPAGDWAVLRAAAWVRMKEGGADAPYVHDRSGPAPWRFSLAFAKLQALLVRRRKLQGHARR